jgi:hypothetical protein
VQVPEPKRFVTFRDQQTSGWNKAQRIAGYEAAARAAKAEAAAAAAAAG